jgi:1-phosphofructokinase family hexose kinase
VPGQVLRATSATLTAGGKGVNVVRAAQALGASAPLAGFTAGSTGGLAAALLAAENVTLRSVEAPGETRSTTIVLAEDGTTTVLNEPGPTVNEVLWASLEQVIAQRLDEAMSSSSEAVGHKTVMLVCSGSVPPGCPDDAYARLVAIARDRSLPVLVDASGALLLVALRAGPSAVTPNLAEAEAALTGAHVSGGGSATDSAAPETVQVDPADARERCRDAAAELHRRGAAVAVVTGGAAGAAVATSGAVEWAPAPVVSVRNPIGAGDAFAAAYAVATIRGAAPAAAVRFAVAAASASVERDLAGALDPRRARELAG